MNKFQKVKSLAVQLHHTVQNAVLGRYSTGERRHIGDTGRPWAQIQRIEIEGIDGWAIVDSFDCINEPFVKLSKQEVISAVINHRGLFATAATLDDICYPVHITHHVTGEVGIDRLKKDIARMFNLSLTLTWLENGIDPQVVPHCRVDEIIRSAAGKNQRCLVYRVGTETNFRYLAKNGVRINEENTYMLGRFSLAESEFLHDTITRCLREFLIRVFHDGVKWNEKVKDPLKHADVPVLENIRS